MSRIAIQVENVSKMYRLGVVNTQTLHGDLNRWWYRWRGKDDPYIPINESEENDAPGDIVWSLKNVSFDIVEGSTVGIMGKNGAGKSTLLKILSRITKPTSGEIKMNGRMASILEVGTGFHPEFTGKENIFMNGAILGMSRKEVQKILEEIVEFSGVGKYIDTPVKRYSSGMYVRLAFSVAAHLQADILILDEVLSVGDLEFQKKCTAKVEQICKKDGKTILFVSHNLIMMERMCESGIYLKRGIITHQGNIKEVISSYISDDEKNNSRN